jgi:hypothetical protein
MSRRLNLSVLGSYSANEAEHQLANELGEGLASMKLNVVSGGQEGAGHKHHHFENRLAFCPTCAAMYVHARQTDDAEVLRSIIDQEVSDTASSAEIRMELAGFDLKTVLGE